MLFSIIVPVYKVEKYLRECVDSILSQSFSDFELILVDDGSPDNCPAICDKYSERNSNVIVIHKKNGGLADARNAGIEKANGDYLIFIDSDDLILPNSLLHLSAKLVDKPDILVTQMLNSVDMKCDRFNKLYSSPKKKDKTGVIEYIFKKRDHEYTSPAQQYIVKTSFIKESSLRFPVGRYHEDVKWTASIFSLAGAFEFYEYVWYLRRADREGSIMSHISAKNVIDEIEIVSSEICSSTYDSLSKKEKRLIFRRLTETFFSQFSNISKFTDVEKAKIANLLDENKNIFKYCVRLKHKCFAIIVKIFGGKRAIKLLSKVY